MPSDIPQEAIEAAEAIDVMLANRPWAAPEDLRIGMAEIIASAMEKREKRWRKAFLGTFGSKNPYDAGAFPTRRPR